MSRIGKLPIPLPKGVTFKEVDRKVIVKGPLGELNGQLPEGITFELNDGIITLLRANDEKQIRMNHGLARSTIANMVKGASEGFTKSLKIIGVGYRCELKGDILILSLGYSHPIYYEVPKTVSCAVEDRGLKIVLKSSNNILLGKVAADIRGFRPPEPYKGKGIRYENEYVRQKEGKAKG